MFKKFSKKRRMPFFVKCGCSNKISEFEELNTLNYAHNNLTHVPEEIMLHERTLEELFLDANRISELPRWLFQCHGLRNLSLIDNEFKTLSPAIGNLVNLENIDISKNGIQEIPDSIKCCKRLSIIEASVNPIGRLPEGFMMLISLRELYLNDTFLEYLPGSFGRLSKLKILEVRENRLKTLPKSLSRLTELERLDVGTNDFDVFPEVISNIESLLELWMDNNKIQYLPKDIKNLKNLMFLDLSKNKLKKLPNEIGECTALSDLYLSENEITELPETIGHLSSLTILKLDVNNIRQIPISIGRLSALSELILSKNNIEELPTNIGLLRNLRTLNLDENKLKSLPSDIGSCTGISLFSLRANKIEYLPDEIGRIHKLRVLNLSSNRLKYLPCSICKLKDLQALWLTENQAKPIIPLQQDKDKTGKRFLTCYLFPQEFLQIDNNTKDLVINKKSILKSKPNATVEEKCHDRQHIIRFTGDEANDSTNENFIKPYPKEMKNPIHHLRNLAIYENSIYHSFKNQNQETGLHVQLLKSLNLEASKENNENEDEQFLLLSNNQTNDDTINLDTDKSEENSNSKYEKDSDLDSDLNELMKLANNKEYHDWRLKSNTNTLSNTQKPTNQNNYIDCNSINKYFDNTDGDYANKQSAKMQNQPAFTNSQYFEVPSLSCENNFKKEQYFFNDQTEYLNGTKFLSPPVPQTNYTYNDRNQHQFQIEPYNQPTPTLPTSINHSPNIKSILRQKNKTYETQLYQNSSPLLNTQLTRENFSHVSTAIKIPTSPLKVNVNVKENHINLTNEAPCSQVSSDSGYSGLTALQMINNKTEDDADLSPNENDSNDSYPPPYESHERTKNDNILAIKIVKNPGLGFSISGGKGSIGNPFKPNDPGIFVTKIHPEGPAANFLRPGDQILKVNGENITDIEHQRAVGLLRSCNKFANLLIKRS